MARYTVKASSLRLFLVSLDPSFDLFLPIGSKPDNTIFAKPNNEKCDDLAYRRFIRYIQSTRLHVAHLSIVLAIQAWYTDGMQELCPREEPGRNKLRC
jgi:hypothetical protein